MTRRIMLARISILCLLGFAQTLPALAQDSRLLALPPGDKPVVVSVGIFYEGFEEIDTTKQTFRALGYLHASWRDSRLAFNAAKEGVDEKIVQRSEVWDPELSIANALDETALIEDHLRVLPDGTVTLIQRFVATMSSPLYFEEFPFDSQKLDLIVESLIYYSKDLVFHIDTDNTGIAKERFFLAEWKVQEYEPKIINKIWNYPAPYNNSSQATFTLNVKRNTGYYWWKFILPMIFITLLGWITFYIELTDISTQLMTSTTVVLVLIAFAITLDFSLPRINYATWLDKFQLICFFFVTATTLENISVHWIFLKGKEKLSSNIHYWSRYAFPLIFLVCLAVFLGPRLHI